MRERQAINTISFRVSSDEYDAFLRLCDREERIPSDVMRRVLREVLLRAKLLPASSSRRPRR